MLDAKQAGGIEVHVEIVGYGPGPKCDCRACRRKWSKATAEERAAVLAEFENFMFRATQRRITLSQTKWWPQTLDLISKASEAGETSNRLSRNTVRSGVHHRHSLLSVRRHLKGDTPDEDRSSNGVPSGRWVSVNRKQLGS